MKDPRMWVSMLIASMLIAVAVATIASYAQMKGSSRPHYSCPDAEWVGNPAVKGGDKYFPHLGWLPDYDIGLCPDGLVVWRKTEKGK